MERKYMKFTLVVGIFLGFTVSTLVMADCPEGQHKDCADNCCSDSGSWTSTVTNDDHAEDGGAASASWSEWWGNGSASYSTSHASGSCSAQATGEQEAQNDPLGSHSKSVSSSGSSYYNWQESHTWSGPGPTCAECRTLVAAGGGSESVTVTCSANQGSSTSASASGSGACSSIDPASATLSMSSITLNAQYSTASSKVEIEGRAGSQEDDSNDEISGSISASGSWSITGEGSKSGTASYSVKSSRQYNGCTSSVFTKSKSGNVSVTGSGTIHDPGSMSYIAHSSVNVSI